jgi:hypothetical protein
MLFSDRISSTVTSTFTYHLRAMVRRAAVFSLCLGLALGTIACGGPDVASNPRQSASAQTEQAAANPQAKANTPGSKLPDGKYPVQQANYDDGDGAYSLMVLDTPPGVPALFEAEQLAMARLTDEEVKAGKASYLNVEGGKPTLYLTPDFKIEYTHNVAEERPNPQTGAKETVVVRQESSFWSPFAGAIAGQIVANTLFRPNYYMPPMYQPGGLMMGYGGYGSTYGGAVSHYQERNNNQSPIAERNRQSFRTTGRIRRDNAAAPSRPRAATGTKASGSGFGTSTLRRSGTTPTKSTGAVRRPSNSSFGSSRSSRPARSGSFGGSRGGRRR